MRKKILLISGVLCFFVITIQPSAYSFWIWSPKTNKWRNPGYSPLASPQAQFKKAREVYDAGEYTSALKEFKKVIVHFPDSKQAPESQYYIGKDYEKLDNPYQAFKEYQKVIDSYPYSGRIGEIVSLQYKIGEYFLTRDKKKWLGISLDDLFEHPSIEIFKKVISNAPYSGTAQSAQYKLGLLYKELARYQEAAEAFKELIEKYPDSEWIEPARYQLAVCSSKASLGAEYDQQLTEEAKEQFQEFVSKHPDAELTKDAQKELSLLRDKEAEKYFKIGEFYFKQKDFKSAEVYYNYVKSHYPVSDLADKAGNRLEETKGK